MFFAVLRSCIHGFLQSDNFYFCSYFLSYLESFNLSGAVSHVRNQSYGIMMGFDFPMFVTKNDWKLFSTIYGAYIGSSQQYENSNMCQDGGYGGYLLSLYKNNFYAGGQ